MAGSRDFVKKAAEILVDELGRAVALKVVERIENETGGMQSKSVAVTLDRLIAAVINVKGGQRGRSDRNSVTAG